MPQWRRELRGAIRDPRTLLRRLALEPGQFPGLQAAHRLWPLCVPEPFLTRMRSRDPADPLLRQVLPVGLECTERPGFTKDPLSERNTAVVPGLLQKYAGRALVVATGACAVHCRYCFRRHYPYGEGVGTAQWARILAHLRQDVSLREVILSGGDPLSLSDTRLEQMAQDLASIPHLRTLRIHTRLPVVVPSRVCETLLTWMERLPLRLVVVIHANHAQEFDSAVEGALKALARTGAVLLNQSVLLRGVNDSVESLAALSGALLDNGVLPYYLHLLDRVQGTGHFEVDEDRGKGLHRALLRRLPGYQVPRLVRETPGAPHKLVV